MNILLIEDDVNKATLIREFIAAECPEQTVNLKEVTSINDTLVALGQDRFDLIIADLVLPQMRGSPDTQDATLQWCEYIENHVTARLSSWVVMTGYSEVADESRRVFARHGVAVVEYDDSNLWKKVLGGRIKEAFVNPALDFVVVCALEKERIGFNHCGDADVGDILTVAGLDCRQITISGLKGVIVVLTEPGLISSAIATVKAAEIFKPRAIAISGICGGIEGESKLGDLIVPDVSWNYQVGKISAGKLRAELMQTPVPPVSKVKLQQMANKKLSQKLRDGLFNSELNDREILTPPMVSGSQVVADKAVIGEISSQSRKVGALDMEVAAVFAAAHDFFNGGGIFFAAKTVVDLADESKDDRYHEYGSALAARFTCHALYSLLRE